MQEKEVFKGLVINTIVTLIASLGYFIINKYFIKYMGIENLGLMKLFTQLLAYLNFAELGLVSASAYALYKPLSEKDTHKISVIMNTISSLYRKIFLFILIGGIILNPAIPFFVKSKVDKTVYLYWTLYVINSAISYTYVKYGVLLTADQKYDVVRTAQGVGKIIIQILQLVSIVYLKSFLIFILLLISENLIQFIFFKIYYKKYYSYILKTNQKDLSIVSNLKNLFWHKLAGIIVYNTDLILISKFLSLETVGIYASYIMITQAVMLFVNIILNVLKPMIGKFIADNSKQEIFIYWKKINILFLFLSILLSIVTYVTIDNFINLWIGKKYILPKFTTILIIINLFVQCFRGLTETFKDGSGFFDDVHLPILESLINFVASIILLQFIGLNGIIIGTIISNISIILIAKPILVFKRCFDRKIDDYISIYLNYTVLITISVIAMIFVEPEINFGEINSVIAWIEKALLSTIIYSFILLIIFFTNKDFRNITTEFLKRIKSKLFSK